LPKEVSGDTTLKGKILMDEVVKFKKEITENIKGLSGDAQLQDLSREWIRGAHKHKWSYNFSWMDRPAIQFPNDAWAMQELIWRVKPDLIIECGIAHGGSLIYYASLLAMLDVSDAVEAGTIYDPKKTKRQVLGIDIDIRPHNKAAIEGHSMRHLIKMIEGSSIAPEIIEKVQKISKGYKRILVTLDSNHTHEHVLGELNAYASLTSIGSYCAVFDTLIEDTPVELFGDRPWGPGNSPKTAVWQYLETHKEFEIDKNIENKLLITVAPDGYLKRVS
jgi:cephalosporin hydroxylase|tara:strand:- start:93 stop:920 length:828 start_codon:yes stop_codon:yes gene_type:complete